MNPVQISPSVKMNNPQVESPKLKNRFYTPMMVGLTLILILLIIPTASLVAASYLSVNIPLVPKNLQRKVDSTIASIPLIPKTPKQIITRVFDNNERIRTSKESFLVSIKNNDQELGALRVTSQLNANDLNKPSLAADIIGEYVVGLQKLKLSLSLTEIDKDLYFKISEIPALPGYNFSQIKGKWFAINLDTAGQEVGLSTRSDNDIYSDMRSKGEKISPILEDEIAKKMKKLPDEKISDSNSFHLQVSPGSQTLTKIYNTIYPEQKFTEEEFQKLFKEVRIDFWINKGNFIVNKVAILTKLNDLSASLGSKSDFEMTFGYQLHEVNKNLNIEAPKSAKNLKSFSDLAELLVEPKTNNLGPVLGIDTRTQSLGSDVLFYERLLHVLTLMPSAVE